MHPRARRKRRIDKRRQSSRWLASASLGVALLVVIGALAVIAPWRKDNFDPETLCPLDGEYARTLVLVDVSDTLNAKQIKEIKENLAKLRRELSLHEWMGVFLLNEDNLAVPKAAIALCNPGSEANPLYQNPEQVLIKYNEQFNQPLQAELAKLQNQPSQRTSPILEMIKAMALYSNFDSTQRRRLIIVSDMLHNVREYSHYSSGFDFDNWQNSKYAKAFLDSTLLRDVDVEVLYVKREHAATKALQIIVHVEFWQDYFAAIGARLKSVTPI